MLATAASSPPNESFRRILQVAHYVHPIFTIRNGISIGSVVFARLARASNTHTVRQTTLHCDDSSNRLCMKLFKTGSIDVVKDCQS